ncbi:MAG: Asp-tRNA(Asn)/Glu-tRNA(Gln) amidotransferase GatCAB subunit C [Candidatus Melainabacteria bacterium HGW-Melainabacteria-1]|nr:MAG: Asp-tRNA(Asn)/Glu-tRNA(Gln) amidotransferase GatCAB subunit C [Candidatus Melainabacteria bacterium HGW-Melainabacteria-1]
MTSISQQQVEHIARLARLALAPDEAPRYGEQLERVLSLVEQLEQLDTESVAPASHALPLFNVSREDLISHRLDSSEIFQNAPETEDTFFRVPQIMSEES